HFADGYSPLPITNLAGHRISAAAGYLDESVRRRANLKISADTLVERLLFEGTRVSGVELVANGQRRVVKSPCVIVSAGAIHSPALLMRSGIGPGEHLQSLGISTFVDLPGVGQNLQEHPAVTVSAYVAPQARMNPATRRHNAIYLRYTSGVRDCGPTDMLMNPICRSAWHQVG